MYGPRLENVEETEEEKGNHEEEDVLSCGGKGKASQAEHTYPLPDQFVDDHATGVLPAEQNFRTGGGKRPHHEKQRQHRETPRQRQGKVDERCEDDGKKGTRRAGRPGGKSGRAETGKMQNRFIEKSHDRS